MARTTPAAINEVPHVVTDYAPDPRGAGLFAALNYRINATLNGAHAVVERSPVWYGWTRTQQQFRGLAELGSPMGRVIAERNSDLSRETTQLTDPSLRIFADRMARGAS